ncbi:ABC transporter permease [Bifidobacterium psychraerophilum]|jgi:peptide/nickel transport system permease protein|uniref:ABC transporter integral membrane protein n=1 Tax=Bifidobacterium psychraerophilum TaxID=218140 RepID=A0A087CBV7_9BIFI|nr:ABC transporter permease [Bifidobacterium psychraerophilum]KFI80757.1 ABC transporter integral membrane protein [Bifidobacterium psychraerophilum]PKA93949.1 peptide/nickel transport system permease protein [Bifidobacterium psychraerophilum DSM 22366]
MTEATAVTHNKPAKTRRGSNSWWNAVLSSPSTMIGGGLLLLIALACVLVPWLGNMDGYTTNTSAMLLSPSAGHPMGTDNVGRDTFTRVLLGGKASLTVGISVAAISGVIGFVVGLYAAYYPKIGYLLMRICDGLMAFPAILFAIVFIGSFGQSTRSVVLALSIVFVPMVARVVRSATMTNMNENYVQVLVNLGSGSFRILWKNIVLNVIGAWIVEVTFVFADAILVEAAMSFIGAGIPQPQASWGNMLYDSRTYIYSAWWMTVFPGVALALTVFVINMFGDGLREVFDPKRRR